MSRLLKLLAFALLGAASVAHARSEPMFVPVFQQNFPDAFVLPVNGEFLAYATNDVQNVPVAVSRDLTHWDYVRNADGSKRDAMPTLAPWVKPGFTWAPEVIKAGGRYVLYYTANHRAKDKQCIGAAVSNDPRGPFVDQSAAPLMCQFELGGSIDPDAFRDKDGKLYLYWKSDGNRVRKASHLFGAALAADGLSTVGAPVDLGISDRDEWKQNVIEAPTMLLTPDGYALLYSGGYFGWNQDQRLSPYAMSFAMCSGPLGPCHDGAKLPFLYSYSDARNTGCLSGPGHQSVFHAKGGTFISFHGWATNSGCGKADDKRVLYIAPFGWENGKPVIAPSLRPTAAPRAAERG